MKSVIAVAISGGVDSLVAAYLLQKQGHHVIGVHFISGYEKNHNQSISVMEENASTFPPEQTQGLAMIADRLGIELKYIDCRQQFQDEVIEYFIAAYRDGRTPNPCLVCNPAIKFGALLRASKSLGATKLATGHYARIRNKARNNIHLLKGIDISKDQSYFLSFLKPSQLAEACFPLGEMKKTDVKRLAVTEGLSPAFRKESQDVCFIADQSYSDFLKKAGLCCNPGEITDRAGNVLGSHNGLHLFTVGQRRGINCPASNAYYVLRLDTINNRLIVGSADELFSSECLVDHVNWIGNPPVSEFTVMTRIRYRHTAALSTVSIQEEGTVKVRFHVPQSAITPGQGAVFYQGDEVLGGGWIV